MKICCKCGKSKTLNNFQKRGINGFREHCRPCRNAIRRQYKKLKHQSLVEEALFHRGGKCEWPGCEWTEDLVWHHRDPDTKKFKVGNIAAGRTGPEVLAEIAKCDLLCPNHHARADRELGVRDRAILINQGKYNADTH